MGKTISVASFEDMAKAAAKLKEQSQTYTEVYTQLMNEASSMGSAWEGADNLAFVQQITGFTEDLKLMADKLYNAGEALDKQRANYVARQENNITQVQKLTN